MDQGHVIVARIVICCGKRKHSLPRCRCFRDVWKRGLNSVRIEWVTTGSTQHRNLKYRSWSSQRLLTFAVVRMRNPSIRFYVTSRRLIRISRRRFGTSHMDGHLSGEDPVKENDVKAVLSWASGKFVYCKPKKTKCSLSWNETPLPSEIIS